MFSDGEALKPSKMKVCCTYLVLSLKFQSFRGFSDLSQIYFYPLDFPWNFRGCKITKIVSNRWNRFIVSQIQLEFLKWYRVWTGRQSPNPGKCFLVHSSYLIFLIYWGNQKALCPSGSSLADISKSGTSTTSSNRYNQYQLTLLNPVSREKYGWVIPF